MMRDIRRICTEPTAEDRAWFPHLVDTPWQPALDFAMRNFKDESFIAQYLSPKVIRDLKLFSILNDERKPELEISAIHDAHGYAKIRQILSNQYNLNDSEPNIQVYRVNRRGDRSLWLRHIQHHNRTLADNTLAVLKHIHYLWRFNVNLETVDAANNIVTAYDYPAKV